MKILKYIMITLVAISTMATSVSCQKTEGELLMMTVASRTGMSAIILGGRQEILWVKYGEYPGWQAMGINSIEGFEYVPGYEYVIMVMAIPVENPPADGDSIRYQYLSTVSKTIKESVGLPDE